MKVLIISSVHPWDDPRILHKQAVSLSKRYDVELYAVADFKEKDFNGIKVIGLPHYKSRIKRLRNIIRLLNIGLFSKAGVVHFHDPELIPVGWLIKKCTHKKVIYDVHEDYEKAIASKFWIAEKKRTRIARRFRKIEDSMSKSFDAVITVIDEIASKFPKDKVYLVKNYPLDIPDVKVKTFDESQKEYNLIYVGSLTRVRGIKEIVLALDYIKCAKPIKLLLVGDFDEPEFENEIKELSSTRNIVMTGRVDYKYLKESHIGLVCLQPVSQYINSLPVKMFEYMSVGIPIVASDFPLWRDIIEQNSCGVVVDPTLPAKIGEAVSALLNDPKRMKEMGLNGREAYKTKYSWESQEDVLYKVYEKILAEK